MWGCYVILLGICIYSFHVRLPQSRTLTDKLVLANGLTAAVIGAVFGWVLPGVFKLTPVYPGPGTFFSFIITFVDSMIISVLDKPQQAVPVDPSSPLPPAS